MNQWMSNGGDCRTASATPGLLKKLDGVGPVDNRLDPPFCPPQETKKI